MDSRPPLRNWQVPHQAPRCLRHVRHNPSVPFSAVSELQDSFGFYGYFQYHVPGVIPASDDEKTFSAANG